MSVEVIKNFHTAVEHPGHYHLLDNLCAPSFVFIMHNGKEYKGIQAYKQLATQVAAFYPTIKKTIKDVITEKHDDGVRMVVYTETEKTHSSGNRETFMDFTLFDCDNDNRITRIQQGPGTYLNLVHQLVVS
jgi:hypothetical protein